MSFPAIRNGGSTIPNKKTSMVSHAYTAYTPNTSYTAFTGANVPIYMVYGQGATVTQVFVLFCFGAKGDGWDARYVFKGKLQNTS